MYIIQMLMLYNVQSKEERRTTGCKGVLFYVLVQLQREISILLIQAIVNDQAKLAKGPTIMLGEQGLKNGRRRKGRRSQESKLTARGTNCQSCDTPEIIAVCGFRLSDRVSKDV